jgi:F-type H+-transporting ATPase subunit delta
MQPVSRGSYAAAVERLETLATGERPVPLAGIADEILAVADLLLHQPRLRRALTDPARSGQDRSELLGSLVAGKVTEDTATLLRTLVAGRWSSSGELLDATERLGVEAVLASADSAGELAEVEDELFRFGQMVDGHSDLAAQLTNSSVSAPQRSRLVRELLSGKAKPATIRLAELSLYGLGGRNVVTSLIRLVELAAARRDRQLAYVRVARPLSEADEQRLGARLSQMYGRQVDTKIIVDPSVIGGVSVRVGHDLYDGTVSRRLDDARAALTATS